MNATHTEYDTFLKLARPPFEQMREIIRKLIPDSPVMLLSFMLDNREMIEQILCDHYWEWTEYWVAARAPWPRSEQEK